MATLTIQNPYKLDGLVNGETEYMIRYEGRTLTYDEDNYMWTVLNVLGNYGKLVVSRDILDHYNRRGPMVKCYWKGNNEFGEEWVGVNNIKDSKWLINYMVECLDGKFDK
jgi:hypothetical protein